MSYDTKCYDLACAFLADYPRLTPTQRARLADQIAQDIQDAIEAVLATEHVATL